MSIHHLRPAVAKHWLLALAGFMWTVTAQMLLSEPPAGARRRKAPTLW